MTTDMGTSTGGGEWKPTGGTLAGARDTLLCCLAGWEHVYGMDNFGVMYLWRKKHNSQTVDDPSLIDSWLENFMYLVIMRYQCSMIIGNDSSQNQQFKTTIDTVDFSRRTLDFETRSGAIESRPIFIP